MDTVRATRLDLARALRVVSRTLGERYAWRADHRHFFRIGGGWWVAVSPDDAGRIRVDACAGTRTVDSLWASAQDHDRLAGLVQSLRDEVAALAAA